MMPIGKAHGYSFCRSVRFLKLTFCYRIALFFVLSYIFIGGFTMERNKTWYRESHPAKNSGVRLTEDKKGLSIAELFLRMSQTGDIANLNGRVGTYHGDRKAALSVLDKARPCPKYMSDIQMYNEVKRYNEMSSEIVNVADRRRKAAQEKSLSDKAVESYKQSLQGGTGGTPAGA